MDRISDQCAQKPTPMSQQDAFVGRVKGLLISLGDLLSPSESAEVAHLIDHGEIGESLRTLAWIVVDGDKRISLDTYNAIRELSAGLVHDEHMPATLANHVMVGGQPG